MPYNLPFKELKTQALARNPIPTAAKPQPEISLYRKAPKPINSNPITTINKVAHPKMVFLFIPIIVVVYYLEVRISHIFVGKSKFLFFLSAYFWYKMTALLAGIVTVPEDRVCRPFSSINSPLHTITQLPSNG